MDENIYKKLVGELLDSQGKLPVLSKQFVKEMAGAVLADQK